MSWYYISNGKQYGPASDIELRFNISSGNVKSTDLVKGPGMTEWIPASDATEQLKIPAPVAPPQHVNDKGEIQCPACESAQVHSGPRGYSFMRGGIFGSSQVIITCLKCGHKFLPGGKPY